MSSDYDLNRFKKTYPFVRRFPRVHTLDVVEAVALTFGGVSSVTYTFVKTYTEAPIVTATADSDVNVFISSLTKDEITVETSAVFTGNVYIQVTRTG